MSSKRKHDISGGIDFTGGQLQIARNVFYTIIGWFSITLEAFLRRNFGERYYTPGNFFIGFLTLTFFFSADFIIGSFGRGSSSGLNYSVTRWVIWLGYLGLSAFHFWKIWVNAQIGRPEHSLYDGTSHLEPIGRRLLKVVNPLAATVAKILGGLTLNSRNRQELNRSLEALPIFFDEEEFTKKWVEPLFVILVWIIVPDVPNLWIMISLIALLVFTRMRYANTRNAELDLSDGIIEASQAKDNRRDMVWERTRMQTQKLVDSVADGNRQRVMNNIREENPDLMDALDELDIELGEKESSSE